MEPEELRERLTPEVKERMMRENWHAHDARWFLKVGVECGFDVANKLNIATVKSMGKTEMKRLLEAMQIGGAENAGDFAKLAAIACETFFSPQMLEAETTANGVDFMKAIIRKCFVFEEVKKAGMTGIYECACGCRHEGWLEGCGLEGEVKILRSMMKGAPFCEIEVSSIARRADTEAGEETTL